MGALPGRYVTSAWPKQCLDLEFIASQSTSLKAPEPKGGEGDQLTTEASVEAGD